MKNIITISREFGSGGRSIGRAVAEKLGYAFYDGELVKEVAQRSGFSPEFIEESGEYANARSSLLFSLATANQRMVDSLSVYDKLYIEQSMVIEELARKGNCVIVGRCADYILRDNESCLHIFIHADMESRAKRVIERYGAKLVGRYAGETFPLLLKLLDAKDKKRMVYYKNYTGRAWGVAKNYDLCLNSGVLGEERCVQLIVDAVK